MENEIKEFFHANAPQPGDETSFLVELNARLEAVEHIRQFHDREIKRTRQTMWAVFAIGLSMILAVTMVILLYPDLVVSVRELFRTLFQPAEDALEHSFQLRNLLFWFFVILLSTLSVVIPIVLSRNKTILIKD
ncbi:MAG: hypothetical protein IJ202_07310 [Bacteroidales bacterium]|nr:hypothetical protein [Bacteroidales bacterium]MBQ9172114.1 hypothetical protein [Bacteroidales bacterium]